MNTERRARIPIFLQVFVSIIAAVLVIVAAGYMVFQNYLLPKLTPDIPSITLPNNATVVVAVQNIGTLETASGTIQQVVVYDPHTFFGDAKKLYVFQGTVVAGVDLSTITKNDVTTDIKSNKDASITLNLPNSQILNSTIDFTQTQTYDANSGVVVGDPNPDQNVVNSIMANAQQAQITDACKSSNHHPNILELAATNAKTQLTAFLTTAGFTAVTVNVSAGSCS